MSNKSLARNIFFLIAAIYATSLFASPVPVFDAQFKASASSKIVESSVNKFDGKVLNTIQYMQGDMKKVGFDGLCTYLYSETSNSGVYYNLKGDLLSRNELTISFWVNLENTPGVIATLIDIVNLNNESVLKVTTETTQRKSNGLSVAMSTSDSKVLQYIDNSKAFKLNEWTFVAISFSGTTGKMTMYLNGGLYKEVSFPKSTVFKNIKKIFIARDYSGNSGLLGSIDEVLIYDSIIPAKTINTIYNNEKNRLNVDGSKRVCMKKICTIKAETSSDPIADIFGKLVFTKNRFTYSCTTISQERGACQTSTSSEEYNLTKLKYKPSYIDTFAGGRLEEIATIASAQSFANKIMSGWKGYCEKGLKGDFSWANDPYFWSSVALSAASGYFGGGGGAADAAKQTAKGAAKEAAKKTAEEAAKKEFYKKMAQYAICTAQAGIDISKMMQDDNIPCDPVDEICSDPKSRSFDDQTYTLSETEYNDMLTKEPDYAKYITVISRQDGQVSFYITYPKTSETEGSAAAKKAAEDVKKKMRDVQALAIAVSAAACVGSVYSGKGANTSQNTGSNDKGFSGADAGKMILTTAANAMCGPACGAAAQVVGALATSWTEVDSCSKKKDADSAGSRHLETLKANRMGLCKVTEAVCVQKDITGQGCALHGYYYCCYDTMLTKILAEQVKAQYALGWEHCTGISLSEFMHISFDACGDKTKAPGAIDGTSLPYDSSSSQRQSAVQSANKCIDYSQYISYIKKLTGDRFGNTENIKKLIQQNNF